ncbi:exo-alpha-sialidase [Microbacterium ureisolvens]|uniref:exo-alpha-sialidase n=1 Tax=Microbacterium ureisolvens TaxID=2781186 RepID=UPI0036387D70
MKPHSPRTTRRTIAAAAVIGLALAIFPAQVALAAPADGTVRTFDAEPVGTAPADCTSVGDVTVADAAFGGAAESNRAMRLNDQTTAAQTRTQCTYPVSTERSVSFRLSPAQLSNSIIVALMGGPGGNGNGAWRFVFAQDGPDLRVQAYNGAAWVTFASVPGGATLRAWQDVTVNATLDRAELIVNGMRFQTTVRVAASTALGNVYFASAGTAATGIDFYVDDLAVAGALRDDAFAGVPIEPLFAGAVKGIEVVDAPIARFLIADGADTGGYSVVSTWRGTQLPVSLSGADGDGWVTASVTHTFPEAVSGTLRTVVTDAAGVESVVEQFITIDAHRRVTVATAPQGVQIRFPDVITLDDGRLLVAYYEASGHTAPSGNIKVTTSSDDGETWTDSTMAVDVTHDARDPKLVQLSDGTILLTYFDYNWAGPTAVEPFLVRSTDGGTTWSDPIFVSNDLSSSTSRAEGWAASHGPIIELSGGDLLAPLYGAPDMVTPEHSSVVRSTDGGLTWDPETITVAEDPVIKFQEPNLTLLPSGEIVALSRSTSSPIRGYLSRSFDDGRTWSDPIVTDLPAQSHHQLYTQAGQVLLTYGNPELAGRPTQGVLIEDPSMDWDGYAAKAVPIYDARNGDQGNPSSAEIAPGEFITLGYDVAARTLTAVFTTAADYRPADGAGAAPGVGKLSSNEGWDTGLHDGSFEVSMDLWWGENASIFRLYQDGDLVAVQELDPESPHAQHAVVKIEGLPDGEYEFTGELINSRGSSKVAPLTVEVTDAAPARPVLSAPNRDGDGGYTVTADLWWGTNATSYVFRENGVDVASGDLTPATPSAQVARLEVTGKQPGTYVYTVEFRNAAGATESRPLTVTVTR